MTWLLTSQGRDHHLVAPHATHATNVPSLREIAHALAHINRFTGHASRAYSVAEHSLLVMDIAKTEYNADPGCQLAALMHDAHESIVGDIASPIKQALGSAWHDFEAMHEEHLRSRYQLTALFTKHHALIKACDLKALATERRDLMPFDKIMSTPWPILDTYGQRVYPWGLADLNSLERQDNTPKNWATLFEAAARTLAAQIGYADQPTEAVPA